jgi:hypothetical protein
METNRTPVEMIAREAWAELHKDLEAQFEHARRNENWHYWMKAWELAAKRFKYKPTFKEWKAAKEASSGNRV